MPSSDISQDKQDQAKDTYPYCGGCGHLYFNLPKVTATEAKEMKQRMLCGDCISEATNCND